jgi:mRNA interferase MazF
MPVTSQIKGYPFEVLVEIEGIKGAVLCDQIRSLDWKARKAKFVAKISPVIVEDALAKVKVLL